MVLVLAATALAVVLAVALVLSLRAGRHETETATPTTKLPTGAEAAIWSILEVVPDPRNHLALTRDLTGEVRIAGTPLDPAWRATAPAPAPAPARSVAPTTASAPTAAPVDLWVGEPTRAIDLTDESLDLAALERAS